MLRSGIKSIGYIFILALFLTPVKAWAGIDSPGFFQIGVAQNWSAIADTDDPNCQLYFPYDKRNRDSFVQVTNTQGPPMGDGVFIHVQVFNDHTADCNENSFWEFLTGHDTIVFDLDDPFVQSDPDGFGFMVVTVVTGDGSTDALCGEDGPDREVLIGNYRIIDNLGFEYRGNAAGFDFPTQCDSSAEFFNGRCVEITDVYTFNFNNAEGADQSDVFGIAVDNAGTGNVDAGGAIAAIFAGNFLTGDEFFTYDSILQFDGQENPSDCENLAFICGDPNETLFDVIQILGLDVPSNRIHFEFGINPSFDSVTASENICSSPTPLELSPPFELNRRVGFMVMPLTLIVSGLLSQEDIDLAAGCPTEEMVQEDPCDFFGDSQAFFVGFTGLNDGDGTGSMDTWWAKPPRVLFSGPR